MHICVKSLAIALFLSCLSLQVALAQTCFTDWGDNNPNTEAFRDILYPVDSIQEDTVTYLQNVVTFDGDTMDYEVTVYQGPYDTSQIKRPAFVFVHGGGFLAGSRNKPEVVDLCKYMAQRGYMVFAPDYRLGYASGCGGTTKADVCCEEADQTSLAKASYRAVQDIRALVRSIRGVADSLHVNKNWIIVGGHSAGAVTALNLAFLRPSEVPTVFVTEMGGLDAVGAYPNNNALPNGIYPASGAINKLAVIDTNEGLPILIDHGSCDDIVPIGHTFAYQCDRQDASLKVHGPASFTNRLESLGIGFWFRRFEHGRHGGYETQANRAASVSQFFHRYLLCTNNNPLGFVRDTVATPFPPCDAIDSLRTPIPCTIQDTCATDTITICKNCRMVKAEKIDSNCTEFQSKFLFCPYEAQGCDTFYSSLQDSTYVCDSLYANSVIAAILQSQNKWNPVAALPEADARIVEGVLLVYPNPSNGRFAIRFTAIDEDLESIQILSIDGKIHHESTVRTQKGLNEVTPALSTQLSPGIYIVKVGTKASKVVIQ